jgi:quercetin dioxygenase-like cupin family protein
MLIAALVLLLCASGAALAQELGRVVYLEGTVTLFQEGEERYVDIGTNIFAGDLLRTGFDGYAELEINTGPTTVVVSEDTALYVERESVRGRTETSFQLLRGDLDFVVDRLVGNDSVAVHTGSVVAGVRGTEFQVRTSPDDSVAIGVTEGRVAVGREQEQIVAEAGVAVQSVNRGSLAREEVDPDEMAEYLAGWQEARMQAFRSGAETFITAYGRRYLDQYPRFLDAYRALAPYEEELRRVTGETGMRGRGDRFRLRAEVSGPAVQVRSILPIFENTFYRLDELAGYHAEGIGRTRINNRLTSAELFRTFNRRRDQTEVQLAEARYLLQLYAALEEGTMGGLPSGDSPFGSGGIRPDL